MKLVESTTSVMSGKVYILKPSEQKQKEQLVAQKRLELKLKKQKELELVRQREAEDQQLKDEYENMKKKERKLEILEGVCFAIFLISLVAVFPLFMGWVCHADEWEWGGPLLATIVLGVAAYITMVILANKGDKLIYKILDLESDIRRRE